MSSYLVSFSQDLPSVDQVSMDEEEEEEESSASGNYSYAHNSPKHLLWVSFSNLKPHSAIV